MPACVEDLLPLVECGAVFVIHYVILLLNAYSAFSSDGVKRGGPVYHNCSIIP